MVCLFHGDYGPPDPTFDLRSGATWIVDANSLKDARNIGEAEAIQRYLLREEPVVWCDQGYAWVNEDAVGVLYIAAFLLVVLPYLMVKVRAWATGCSRLHPAAARASDPSLDGHR